MTVPVQRPHRSKQDYCTPALFLDRVKKRLQITTFGWDFAASIDNSVSRSFWDERDDALKQPWDTCLCPGEWGWLNPPYTDIKPWACKCKELKTSGGQVALLVPASVGSNWFRDYVDGVARVLFLNGRLAFMPDKPTWLYPKDCILALYGASCAPGYEVWSWRTS